MRQPEAHLRQVGVKNGRGQDRAPTHAEDSSASLREKLCDFGGWGEVARAAGGS